MSSPSAPPPTERGALLYTERLWAPWTLWVVVLGMVTSLGIAYGVAVGPVGGLVTGIVAAAVCGGFIIRSAALVRVSDRELVAGRARIPVKALGEPVALDAERTRWLRGPGIDPSAYHLVRGWVPTAVHVEVLDPRDPTPYWLIATRDPVRLAQAIDVARAAGSGR
jgi:hypothetical protein